MQKSGYRGPRRRETNLGGVWAVGDKFEAVLAVDGMILTLGEFDTAQAAHDAITLAILRGRESQRSKRRLAAMETNI